VALWAQTETPPAAFDVVSIKPHQMAPGTFLFRFSEGGAMKPRGNTYQRPIMTVVDLIMDAYDVKAFQVSGLPPWALSPAGDHFDIMAKSEKEPTPEQLRQMVQAMLADRFQLKFHRETRELPVYALIVGKNGHKMRELTAEEIKAANAPQTGAANSAPRPFQTSDGGGGQPLAGPPARSTMPMLISLLSNVVDRPVIDHSDLKGRYEYPRLDWREFGAQLRGTSTEPGGVSVYTALQQELGLKLEARKEPTDVLVIDRVEKPSGN
jgi:uncharacterized protein (TIGR03435 family)